MFAELVTAPVRRLVRRRRIALGIGIATVLVTSACAAGQQAQTADESPSLDGTNTDIGSMALRGLAIQAPSNAAYQPGTSANLRIVLVNRGKAEDRLTAVSASIASGWVAYGVPVVSSAQAGAPSSSAPAEVLKPVQSVPIPAGGRVSYGVPESSGSLALTGLKSKLYPGTTVTVHFTFANAGSADVAVPVQLSATPPTAVLPGPSATGQEG